MKKLIKNSLLMSVIALASMQVQAEFNYQAGFAKITDGGADSLAKAQAIMYNNQDSGLEEGYVNPEWFVDDANQDGFSSNTNFSGFSSNTSYQDTSSITTPTPTTNYNNYAGNYYNVSSKGAIVVDAKTGNVIFEKNADVARPIASISKVMTAIVVMESNLNMKDLLTIDTLDFKTPKKSGSDRLRVGDQLNRGDMLLMMMMKSENPAAKALARTDPQGYDAFIAKMNKKARELGMTQTRFYDPSGLDKRNVASPRDLAILTQYASRHPVVSQFSTMPNRNFGVYNVNSGFRSVPARSTNYMVRDGLFNLVLSKTGYIREAGNCVVLQTNINNKPSVVVLLGANDSKTRWRDAENILKNL